MAYTTEMKQKLQEMIDDGKRNVPQTLAAIQEEFEIRRDFLVKPDRIAFHVEDELRANIGNLPTRFTPHSRRQLLEKIGMPTKFYDELVMTKELKDLAAYNLRRLVDQHGQDGMMFRTVGDLTKGVLSPSFGRYDAAPIIEAFVQSNLDIGFIPQRAKNTSYRYSVTFIGTEMVEIAPNEFVVPANTFNTSDYGSGANHYLGGWIRVWCKNLAMGYQMFRKVHIGSRFQNIEGFVQMSETTNALDVRTIASAIRDVTHKTTEIYPKMISSLRAAAEDTDYDVDKAILNVQKTFGKDLASQAKTLFETSGLSELPTDRTAWRMSNVLSLLAKSQDEDTGLDMERAAYDVLGLKLAA